MRLFKKINIYMMKKHSYLIVSPIITMIILLAVFYLHGVYPFGDKSISYYDMAQSYVPLYYRTWDVLHGLKNVFFDWNVGMGCQMADVAGPFIFFPSNLFFMFVRRENILLSMSLFLIIKMMISAFSASFYFSNKCVTKIICIYAGIAYAFCGFVLQYYTNIYYLDFVMIFPLLVLSLERLLYDGKKYLYIVLIFLCFLGNQQLTFTIVIYIVIKGWFIARKIDEKCRGNAIVLLVVASIIGAFLGAFSFVPAFYVTTMSSRFNNATNAGIYEVLKTITCDFQNNKNFMIYGGEIALGAICYLALFNRKELVRHKSELCMIFIMILPIIFENVDLLWHGGSYQHFPMRFGYMLAFELIAITCSIVEEHSNCKKENMQAKQICVLAVGCLVAGLLFNFCKRFREYGIRELSSYDGYIFCLFFVAIAAFLVLKICDDKIYIATAFIAIAIIQAGLGSFGLIAPEKTYSMESDNQFVVFAESVYENLVYEDDTNRIKDRNIDLNSNYGLILRQSSLGGWMNGINPSLQSAMLKMGYSAIYTKVSDVGGSALTDALLGVKRLYSKTDVNSDLYQNGMEMGIGKIYDSNYNLPFCKVLSEFPTGAGYEYQNSLFYSLTGIQKLFDEIYIDDLAEVYYYEEGQINIFECKVPVNNKSVLYIYGERDKDIVNQYSFAVNDKQVQLGAEGFEDNVMYAKTYLNGFLELGSYENETVDLKIITVQDSLKNLHIGLMDLDKFEEGIKYINDNIQAESYVEDGRLIVELESSIEGDLLLPIGYTDCYEVTLDDKHNVQYNSILENAFVGINIGKGGHRIEVLHKTKGLRTGIIFSICGIILCVLLFWWNNISRANKLNMLFVRVYDLVFAAVIVFFYFVPIIVAIWENVIHIMV